MSSVSDVSSSPGPELSSIIDFISSMFELFMSPLIVLSLPIHYYPDADDGFGILRCLSSHVGRDCSRSELTVARISCKSRFLSGAGSFFRVINPFFELNLRRKIFYSIYNTKYDQNILIARRRRKFFGGMFEYL